MFCSDSEWNSSGDVLMSTVQNAEACASGHVCFTACFTACKCGDCGLKMFCLIIIQAVAFKRTDGRDNFTGPRLEECVYAAL